MDDDEFDEYVGTEDVVGEDNHRVQEQRQQAYHVEQVIAITQIEASNLIIEEESNNIQKQREVPIVHGQDKTFVDEQDEIFVHGQDKTFKIEQQQMNMNREEQIQSQILYVNQKQIQSIHKDQQTRPYHNKAPVLTENSSISKQVETSNKYIDFLHQEQSQLSCKQQLNGEDIKNQTSIASEVLTNDQPPHGSNQNHVLNSQITFSSTQNPLDPLTNQQQYLFSNSSLQPTSIPIYQLASLIQNNQTPLTQNYQSNLYQSVQPNIIHPQNTYFYIHRTATINDKNETSDSQRNQTQQIQQISSNLLTHKFDNHLQNEKSFSNQQKPYNDDEDDEFGDFETQQQPESDTQVVCQSTENPIQNLVQQRILPQQPSQFTHPSQHFPSEQIVQAEQSISQKAIPEQIPINLSDLNHLRDNQQPSKQTASLHKEDQPLPISEPSIQVSLSKPLTLEEELLKFLDSLPDYNRISQRSFYDTS